jgi:uncharacterized protein (DUF488 family)
MASSFGRWALMPQQNRLNLPTASPRQQAENKAAWNDARTIEGAHFFTFGYSGRTIDELLAALTTAGVRTLVDIRQNAVSMYRAELSKVNLQRIVEVHGMHYVHLPELGVPRDIRARAIATGSRQVIWDWYDEHVAQPYLGRNLHHFLNSLEHPVAMMCTEHDPTECHRHRLFLMLEAHGLHGFDL